MYSTDTEEQREIIVLADNIAGHIRENDRLARKCKREIDLIELNCETQTLRKSRRKLMIAYYRIEDAKVLA